MSGTVPNVRNYYYCQELLMQLLTGTRTFDRPIYNVRTLARIRYYCQKLLLIKHGCKKKIWYSTVPGDAEGVEELSSEL